MVCINHFTQDTEAEIALLEQKSEEYGARAVVASHWAHGGAGAEALAAEVIHLIGKQEPGCTYVYPDELPLWEKITAIATKLYGAAEVTASAKVRAQIAELDREYRSFPICMGKTQMSFATDPGVRGAPSEHTVDINEVRLANGAGFIVAICGNMMTMPGLPKVPAAENIDIDGDGQIIGLF